MKIFISELLLNYKIIKTPKTPGQNEWVTKSEGFMMGTSKPLEVGFEKR